MRPSKFIYVSLLSAASAVFAAEDAVPVASDQAKPVPEHLQKTCLQETGSRIPRRHDDDCLAVHGTVYGRDDLQSSGQVLIGESLWRLDPAITVSSRHR